MASDPRGSLGATETQQDLPFEHNRLYQIFGTKEDVERGFHAHKNLQKIVVVAQKYYTKTMKYFIENCVLLIFSDKCYTKSDYIYNYNEFLNEFKQP